MRASELKKRYPEFWAEMETAVLKDLRDCMPQVLVKMSYDPDIKYCRLRRIAHNAAFNATYLHHKALMSIRRKKK